MTAAGSGPSGAAAACGCYIDATRRAATGRDVLDACSCLDYAPGERCDEPFCLLAQRMNAARGSNRSGGDPS